MDSFDPAPSVTWEPRAADHQDFCPHCGGALEPDTVACPHCNQLLVNLEQADELLADQSRRSQSPQVTLAIIGVAVVLALIGVGVVAAIWPLLHGLFE